MPQEIDLGKRDLPPTDPNNPIGLGSDPNPPQGQADPSPAPAKEGDLPRSDEYSPREKQLYARTKDAEAKLKEYKEKYGDIVTPPAPTKSQDNQSVDPFDLASTVAALQGYDQAELKFASKIAKMDGINPAQAIQTEEFKTFLKGKRGTELRDNSIPRPNNSAPSGSVKTSDEISKMSDAEFAAYEREFNAGKQGRGI